MILEPFGGWELNLMLALLAIAFAPAGAVLLVICRFTQAARHVKEQ